MYKKKWSNKAYGIFFSIIFICLSLIPLYKEKPINLTMLLIALVFLFFSFLIPKVLKPLITLWDLLGKILYTVFNPIMMFILYFGIITPLGISFKIMKRRAIIKNFKYKENSYWIKRKETIQNMKKQF